MRNFKRAKMTGKARAAVETYADHYRIAPEDVRQDRAAIRGIYAELEQAGYAWIPAKQAWAFTSGKPKHHELVWTMVVDPDAAGEILYLLEESLKASGYKLLASSPVPAFDGIRPVIIMSVEISE